MSASELFLLAVRWLHLVSAAAWVGGSLFYLLVLRPALRRSPESSSLANAAGAEFRALVDTSIFVLVATGIILMFNRLTGGVVGAPYVVTLSVKIVLSMWMFLLAWRRRPRTTILDAFMDAPAASTRMQKVARVISGYNAIVILGIAVFLLSDLLKVLFEMALRG